MFKLRIMAILINSLIKYGLATYNGGWPTSQAILGA